MVGTTLNGVALSVNSFDITYDVAKTQWDAWENGAYIRKTKVYGIVRTIKLSCQEGNVAWASSAVAGFLSLAKLGTTVSYVSDYLECVETGVNVVILQVTQPIQAKGTPNLRYFTVTIQTQQ